MAFHIQYHKNDIDTSGVYSADTKEDIIAFLESCKNSIYVKEIGIDGPAPMGKILIEPKLSASWKNQNIVSLLDRLQTLYDTAYNVINPKRS